MGVLTDLVIAGAEEAEEVAKADGGRWPRLDVKGHDAVTFEALLAIVSGREVAFDNELLAEDSDHGPWVTRVDADFVSAIAALGDEQLPAVAEAWVADAEMDGWNAGEAAEWLRGLREFCRSARGATMLMWMSL